MLDLAVSVILGFFGFVFRTLPRPVSLSIGRGIGYVGYLLAKKRRRLALDNLEKALGDDRTPKELKTIARKSFSNLGMTLVEYFTFPSLDLREAEKISDLEGEEYLVDALKGGRGVLVLTLHLDNVDLTGALLAVRGYPVAIIAKAVRNSAVERALLKGRESTGVQVFGVGSMKQILRHLKDSGIVGFVLDQDALPEDGVLVTFFGRDASTLSSLAVLARRTGVQVVPVYMFRDGVRHRIVVEPPIIPETIEDREEDILSRTRQYAQWTEKVIRRHPEQWMWLHNRWKRSPGGEYGPQ